MIKNGRISTKQLRQVDGWAWLAPGTAAAWLLFAFACQMRWGVRPTITSPDGAYRSYARQLWWWANRFIKRVVVAFPGTSNHGLGTAIDVYNWARFPRAAFVALAAQHGFVFDTPSEKWHMRYTRIPNYYPLASATPTTAKLLTTELDEDMILISLTDAGATPAWVALNLNTGNFKLTRDKAEANRWSRIVGRAKPASNADLSATIRVIKETSA